MKPRVRNRLDLVRVLHCCNIYHVIHLLLETVCPNVCIVKLKVLWRLFDWDRVQSRRIFTTEIFRLLLIFCFRNHYSLPLSTLDGIDWPGLAWSIHYPDTIMLVISWNGSHNHKHRIRYTFDVLWLSSKVKIKVTIIHFYEKNVIA